MTGLPFVYAVWAGRYGALTPAHVQALQRARDAGLAALPEIARDESAGDPRVEAEALAYLRDNLKYGLGEAELAGLGRFHSLAVELGVMPALVPVRFYA
jgi:predicted solute-binding protein